MQIVYLAGPSPHGIALHPRDAHAAHGHESRRSSGAHKTRGSQAPGDDLTAEQRQQVDELKQVDREVRAHEQAHLSRAGAYATGAPTFTYTTGPDGKQYAVAGEVKVDTSPEADPEATLRKAEAIGAAASAPAEPSSQDRMVAAQASRMANEAQQELAEERSDAEKSDTDHRLRGYGPPPPDDTGRLLSLLA
ncbi:MAG: hypothetical protein CL477_02160 [Acidobacteria bacterium]|jgi:hypothetical protein|nr:hypothetical protein [Acidobacteriota bacterium]MDP7339698.1 putative metalloprotease CJM1_0395 family protein [Vicinamibacterales bacterium]MDP7479639.1 putative metalloprotease CJM1_0395 family protein [Vicinamibacterales bacterium]MDP7692141.1 putative metalloprotease CJM1_0395 family protein [Vicinamibacterales bacterium]HJN46938.1 putative metalloprotease CJM1_0395 family protein [Vicinamibacterales bacterium]|tara:strand:+ start:355 stop:930 length:576 start_codon:yes stop_codon:yes gene_type:complete